jgi:indolepyruvate ferredoxin oxidoreductase
LDDVAVRIAGIGGTGVVTAAQVLGTAAMLGGFSVRGLDQIGLSQKAGPVVSDLHFTRFHDSPTNRLGAAEADVLLAFDQLVAASDRGRRAASPEHTIVVGSTTRTPTGAMILHPDLAYPSAAALEEELATVTQPGRRYWTDAGAVTTAAFGDPLTANLLVIGMAVQAGAVPIEPELVETALSLNGVAVDANTRAFRLGRLLIADPAVVAAVLATDPATPAEAPGRPLPADLAAGIDALAGDPELTTTLNRCTADLVAYQHHRYAAAYLATVIEVAARERAVVPGSTRLTHAVATNLHKLLAYKDEYEVARLLLDPDARRAALQIAGTAGVLQYRLHPPALRALGLRRKVALGPWSDPLLRAMAHGRRLRGTPFDPFGMTAVRREERRLPTEYRAALDTALPHLRADNLDVVVALAELPDLVRGYEALKVERIGMFRERLARSLSAITG